MWSISVIILFSNPNGVEFRAIGNGDLAYSGEGEGKMLFRMDQEEKLGNWWLSSSVRWQRP